MAPPEHIADPLTLSEMVDALLVFDEPVLNARYHGLMQRLSEGRMRDEMSRLPALIIKSGRVARRGSEKWMGQSSHVLDEDFLGWGERALLESFLSMTESQLRLIAYMVRSAPTQEVRKDFDEMAQIHREIAHTLRETLSQLVERSTSRRPAGRGSRGVQEEDASGDLRGQIEEAIRDATQAGHAVRLVMLSPTGLRHLRDQGCFKDGQATLGGAPVTVDLSWTTPAFALLSFDAIPLEEIFDEAAGRKAES